VLRDAIDDDRKMIAASSQLQLSTEEKLNLLRQVDRWRPWSSLDDRRLCLGCGRLINGNDIEIMPSVEGGQVEVRCPTQGCQSIPLDWILPNPRDRHLK
jgi:hypothetical protein